MLLLAAELEYCLPLSILLFVYDCSSPLRDVFRSISGREDDHLR